MLLPVVPRHHNVDARTGLADGRSGVIIHFAHSVCERPSGIDNTFGSHIKLLPCEEKQHQLQTPLVLCLPVLDY